MNLSDFKPPRLPIARPAARMGHSDNLNGGFANPVNYTVRKTSEEKSPRTMQMHSPSLRTLLDLTNGVIEFRDESIRGRGIAFGIPLVGRFCLNDGVRMNPNAWCGQWLVRGSGVVPRTRESSLPCPGLDHRCVAQSPHSTPIQHPHRLSHPSSQADDRQARHAPRWEDAAPLSGPSHDWASCLQINCRTGFRQSTYPTCRLTAFFIDNRPKKKQVDLPVEQSRNLELKSILKPLRTSI